MKGQGPCLHGCTRHSGREAIFPKPDPDQISIISKASIMKLSSAHPVNVIDVIFPARTLTLLGVSRAASLIHTHASSGSSHILKVNDLDCHFPRQISVPPMPGPLVSKGSFELTSSASSPCYVSPPIDIAKRTTANNLKTLKALRIHTQGSLVEAFGSLHMPHIRSGCRKDGDGATRLPIRGFKHLLSFSKASSANGTLRRDLDGPTVAGLSAWPVDRGFLDNFQQLRAP